MAQRGFTMVELIVTMIIIGIMAVVVLPRMDLLRGFDEIGFRDQVRATLEYARKSAVAQRRNVRVAIAGGTVTVTIDNDIPEGAGAGSYGRALTLPGANGNQITAPSGVTLTPDTTLTFGPLGVPSAAATLTVSGAGNIVVEAETGYVH
ncbi:MAG: GspH/FimT family pseudopilin [Pseudomonadota bacterium]